MDVGVARGFLVSNIFALWGENREPVNPSVIHQQGLGFVLDAYLNYIPRGKSGIRVCRKVSILVKALEYYRLVIPYGVVV